MATMHHFNARCIDIDYKRGHLLALLAVDDFRRRFRHDYEHPGFDPFVHQSFSPLMMKCFPSGVGSACVTSVAGSDPTPASVKANAEISPFATRGKYLRFCSSVPNRINGCGTPID